MNSESLSHTKWNCKYHIVFAPKYRRKQIYGKLKKDIGKILRLLCARKEIQIIEAECCKDHVQEDIVQDQISMKEYVDPFDKEKMK